MPESVGARAPKREALMLRDVSVRSTVGIFAVLSLVWATSRVSIASLLARPDPSFAKLVSVMGSAMKKTFQSKGAAGPNDPAQQPAGLRNL